MLSKQVTEFRGSLGQAIWARIADHVHLVTECKELHTDEWMNIGPYSEETTARLMTFFQIMVYGYHANKAHSYAYPDGKLERNRYLVKQDPGIISIALSESFQYWRVEKSPGEFFQFSTGYAIGGSIVYPLNRDAVISYDNNDLPPFLMSGEHFQLNRRSNGRAAGVFIGAAINLHAYHQLAQGEILQPKEAIGEALSHNIKEQVLNFIPMIDLRGRGSNLRIINSTGGALPKIFTAFNTKADPALELAAKVGFIPDEDNLTDANSNDWRYELDFNAFNDAPGDSWKALQIQKGVLDGWAWFLESRKTKQAAKLSERLRRSYRELVNKQNRLQCQEEQNQAPENVPL